MRMKELLSKGDISQGDWVSSDKYHGVFICRLSERESVIACYNDRSKKYVTVKNNTLSKSDGSDNDLLQFAKKHLLWHHKQKKSVKK